MFWPLSRFVRYLQRQYTVDEQTMKYFNQHYTLGAVW